MQGETTAVNGEQVRMKLLRMCACATAITNAIHLPPVFVQKVMCKWEQKQQFGEKEYD